MVEQLDCLLASEPRYSQMREQFRGCVFDSAPCYMSPLVGAAAIGHGMPAPLRLLAALAFLLSMLLMMPFAPRRPWAYWCRMRELRLGRRRVQGQGAWMEDTACSLVSQRQQPQEPPTPARPQPPTAHRSNPCRPCLRAFHAACTCIAQTTPCA